MSAHDRKSDGLAPANELPPNGVGRRSFLKYFAGAFAAMALPEAVDGCSAPPAPGTSAAKLTPADFASVPITWVTRKEDGLSLGFQFVNLTADASHNIALAAPGSAYVAITFPPQHVVEDAFPAGTAFTYVTPASAYASGTTRLVFAVPTSYGVAADAGGVGTFPYTLQGMLELCAVSTPVVNANAVTAAPVSPNVSEREALRPPPEERKYETISQARIDRVIGRVDPRAALRVQRRTLRAARTMKRARVSPMTSRIRPLDATNGPVQPGANETSIELPFRLLMSPDNNTHWAFMPSPVASPATSGADAKRTELWHARPGPVDKATGMADPSLGGVTLRALWTRDYDIYNSPPASPTSFPTNNSYTNDPVALANPIAPNRDAIVWNTAAPTASAMNVNRLMLTPLGGTLDVNAQFDPNKTPVHLLAWAQTTVLGRDEYVESVNVGTLLPFGHVAAVVVVNKRAEDPTQGTVGVLYSQTYLVVSEPLVSYHDLPNASAYNTFPFVAVELKQTKIPCAGAGVTNGISATASNFVYDPTGATMVIVSATGTDFRGNPIQFTTPLYFCGASGTPVSVAAVGAREWNDLSPTLAMNRQRIAFAPPNDGPGASATGYSTDGTSFETASFTLKMTTSAPTPAGLVPIASNITLAVEALRHLQTSPSGGTPNVDAVFNYDTLIYAANGFDAKANPNQIFLVEATAGQVPSLNFSSTGAAASNSGGLVAPAFGANALSRSQGPMAGDTTKATSALMSGAFHPTEYFGAPAQNIPPAPPLPPGQAAPSPGFLDHIKLFGFIPLAGIISAVESGLSDLASDFMPKSVTQELSNAEAFLQKAVMLYGVISSAVGGGDPTSGQIAQVLTQVTQDINQYTQLAQGLFPGGSASSNIPNFTSSPGAPLTNAEMQAAAWLASAATQAQSIIQKWEADLGDVYTAAVGIYNDVVALDFETLLEAEDGGPGDLQNLLTSITKVITDVESLTTSLAGSNGASPGPQSAAGAVLSYFGPVANAIKGAVNDINGFLNPLNGVLTQLITDLGYLQQGLDMAKNMCVEFKWKPKICGYECLDAVAFVPSTSQAFSLDIKLNENSNNGPTGLSLTCRLDSFAIAFGQGIKGTHPGICAPMDPGYTTLIKNADISVVFDHIQVQMLAGQKPDIDCVFKDLYFGGDLSFIETIKNLIPLDAFSDPPFIKVTTSGISAGLTIAIPNIAIGMFSIQNINIGATLNVPWIAADLKHGVTFEFDFCTIANPFVVTVSMLGGGGFFGMTLDMNGIQRLQFGVSVGAQLAIDLTVASGCVSIEAGIFLVYMEPGTASGTDPVTGEPEVDGWVIGGYLRLRGELDILGIITISVELYLEIIYESSTGKCIATGYVKVDISLFFFSIHVKVSFTRKFAGSNGDPTFAELMSAGGVDPMVDPALTSGDPAALWDPFAEYCMAYA